MNAQSLKELLDRITSGEPDSELDAALKVNRYAAELLAVAVAVSPKIKADALDDAEKFVKFMRDVGDVDDKKTMAALLALIDWYRNAQISLAALDAKMKETG